MEWFFELRLARHLAPFFPFRPVFLWRPLGVSLPVVEKREREKKKRRRGPRVSAHNAPPSPVLSGPILEGARGQAFPLLTPSTEVTAGFHESLEAQTHPPPPHCSPPEPRGSAAALSGAAPNPRDLVLPALASQSLPGRSECPKRPDAGRETFSPGPPLPGLPSASDLGRELANFACKYLDLPLAPEWTELDLWPSHRPLPQMPVFARSSNLTPGSPQLPLHILTPILACKGWGGREESLRGSDSKMSTSC